MSQMYKKRSMLYLLSIILITQRAHSMLIRRTVSQLRSLHTSSRVALCHDKNVKLPLKMNISSAFAAHPWNNSVKKTLDPHKVLNHLNTAITGGDELKQYIVDKVAKGPLNFPGTGTMHFPDHIRLVGSDKNKLKAIATAIACALERPIYHIDLSDTYALNDKEFILRYAKEWGNGMTATQVNNPALIITSAHNDRGRVFKSQGTPEKIYVSDDRIKALHPLIKPCVKNNVITTYPLLQAALRIEIASEKCGPMDGMFEYHIE